MSTYFESFPRIGYNIDRNIQKTNVLQTVPNILTRIRVIQENLNSVFNYYDYTIKDSDTPEILADRYYQTPYAHWLILLTNNIIDRNYGWPLREDEFDSYIEDKYGSQATAKTQVHHYEIVTRSVDQATGIETTRKKELSSEAYTASALPTSDNTGTVYTIGNDTITVYEYKTTIYAYDWEFDQNEAKRRIKIIRPEYYESIRDEFEAIMERAIGTRNTRLRTL